MNPESESTPSIGEFLNQINGLDETKVASEYPEFAPFLPIFKALQPHVKQIFGLYSFISFI